MSSVEETTTRSRGRPPTRGLNDKILHAALRLLSSVGYDAMSMEAVAAEAGVTKPTLYRRWSSKEQLAIAAVATIGASEHAASDSEDVWAALLSELRLYAVAIGRPNGMALIGTLLTNESARPGMLEMFRRQVSTPRRDRLEQVLVAGQNAGVVRTDVDIHACLNLIIGYYYAAYIGDGNVDDDWPSDCLRIMRLALEASR